MGERKLVLIHGYSDAGSSFDAWAGKLRDRGMDARQIDICSYLTLNNEITIADIAEGLTRATASFGWTPDQEFDAIVHSTGMLVIRAWLCNDPARRQYLKHLVGLAPATWGSPLAQLGRSCLGAIVEGNREFGPDFLNAGDRVLDALELGSRFTWDLAHRDLLGSSPLFTVNDDSPYVAVFIGNQEYSGIRELANKPATDGTVRWAGCALNARKFTVDLRKAVSPPLRAQMAPWAAERLQVPMFAVEGKNHTTILHEPEDDLADLIVKFLAVSSESEFNSWVGQSAGWSAPALQKMKQDSKGPHDGWQQFVIHVADEYGDPVPDYVVDLFKEDPTGLSGDRLKSINFDEFDLDVHPYGSDQSYRCFHMRLPLGAAEGGIGQLWMRLAASSGTKLIAYQGYVPRSAKSTEQCPVVLNLSHLLAGGDSLFHPFTTTLVEISLTREPLPLEGTTQLMTMSAYQPVP
ncbi:MAG: esterase/lipase family protein [Bryobacteraceae bacterium]